MKHRSIALATVLLILMVSSMAILPIAALAADSHGQTLIMGAQKDFKLAAEGKLLVFDPLIRLDEQGNPVPALAESWQISSNGKEWIIRLRQGVSYHDGTAFTARTAKFSIERAMLNAVWSKYVENVKVLDRHTLKIIFNTYYESFLRDMTSGWISENLVSPMAVSPQWDLKGKIVNYIGTGPFRLDGYKKDREAVLVRNDEYWGPKTGLKKIIWQYTPDPYAQILALKAGELDIIGAPEHHSSIPFIKLAELKATSGMTVSTHSYGRIQVLEFNCRKSPFNEAAVREALNFAVDRQTMVRSLFGDVTTPSYQITDPGFIWGPSNITSTYRFDKKRALDLLAGAGWSDTDGNGILDREGKQFRVELVVPTGEANADMVAQVVQAQLREIGIVMNITTLTNANDWRRKGKYDLFLHHSGCLPSIPGGIGVGGKYHGAGDWPYAFHSDKLDSLIEAAFTSMDAAQMRARIDDIWLLLQKAHPCIPLYDITKAVIINPGIKGYRHGATMFEMDLTGVEITR